MKALFHMTAGCGSIHSPRATGSWTFCDCGQAAIRWTDPAQGLAEVWAADPNSVRVIGFNNTMLTSEPLNITDEKWRRRHQLSSQLVGTHYLFSDTRRDCWAVLFAPGDTGDVKRVIDKPFDPIGAIIEGNPL